MSNEKKQEGQESYYLNINPELLPEEPSLLLQELRDHGALNFIPFSSGMFPASAMPEPLGKETGMTMSWFRDNAHVAYALFEYGTPEEKSLAIANARAMLSSLLDNEDVLNEASEGKRDSDGHITRLPVRVDGETLENDHETRVQNDSVGYQLWLICKMANHGELVLNEREIILLSKLADYFHVINYWSDPDSGTWEEDFKVHASSIGVVIGALEELRKLLSTYSIQTRTDLDDLIKKGRTQLKTMLTQRVTQYDPSADSTTETNSYYPSDDEMRNIGSEPIVPSPKIKRSLSLMRPDDRPVDASMLFLVTPLGIMHNEDAEQIVEAIEDELVMENGVGTLRYIPDTYYDALFTSRFTTKERTSRNKDDKPGEDTRVDARNQTAVGTYLSDTAAQWTLFDSLLAEYYGKKYLESLPKGEANEVFKEKHYHYLRRAIGQIVELPDGRWKIPELFYFDKNKEIPESVATLRPNDHIPLLWSQANLLRAIGVYSQVFQNISQGKG